MEELLLRYFYGVGRSPVGSILGRITRSRAYVLTYHRVLPAAEHARERGQAGLSVSVEAFEEQMSWLAAHCVCLSLDDLVSGNVSTRERNVVITFDDGYRDNLTHALPVLQRYGVPFAVYCTTRFLTGDCTMWWYEIPGLLDQRQALDFTWRGRRYRLALGSSNAKLRAFRRIRAVLMSCDAAQQADLLDVLRGHERPRTYESLCLSAQEVRELDRDPLCTIGAHTVNHDVLANQDEPTCRRELQESKTFLEQLLDHRVDHLAYPFGGKAQAGHREFQLAKDVGFRSAVTMVNRPLKMTEEEALALPRQPVRWLTRAQDLEGKLNGWSTLCRVNG